MPRRYATKPRPRRVRRYVRRPTVRKPMAKIMRAIRKVDRKGSQIIWLRNRIQPTNITDSTFTSPTFYHPHNLNASSAIFGTSSTDLDANAFYHRYTTLHVKYTANTENDFSNWAMYFVRLTKYAQDRINYGAGSLNALTTDLHFSVNPGGGVPGTVSQASTFTLNPKYFKTLYVKRFHTVSNAGAPSLAEGGNQQFFWTKTLTIRSKYRMMNPGGDAKTLAACPVPQNNWFIIFVGASPTPISGAGGPYFAVEEVSSWIAST